MTVWISNIKSKENMKRIFNALGLMLAATLTLTNCTKNIETPVVESEGVPFEIVASTVETKTVNDGMSTLWAAGDQINLFHAVAGTTTYSNDNNFTVNNVETGLFKGTLTGTLAEDSAYDWYAFYPYTNKMTTPANTAAYAYIGNKNGLTQNGYDSMAHVSGTNCPLYGVAKAVPSGEMPSLQMHHLSSVIAVKVTNTLETPLKVNEVIFTADGNELTGSFYINIAGDKVSYKSSAGYVSTEAKATVSNATELAQGESATVYLVVKPFEAYEGDKLEIFVNGYKKELYLEKDVDFEAGKIKTLNFAYDKEPAPGLPLPWYEDFSSKDLSKYTITNGTGTSTTALYTEDPLAGGSAPELLIANSNGSFAATLATGGYVGDLTLTFKSNHPDYLTVTATDGVSVKKVTTSEYTLTVPEGVISFSVTLKNTNTSSNTRVDDIEVAKPRLAQTISFETTIFDFVVGSDEMNSFAGQTVSGNQTSVSYASNNVNVAVVDSETGAVTLTGETGTAVITATAVQTDEYKSAVAAYSINVSDPNAVKVEKTVTYNFGTDAEVGFSKWGSSYMVHTASYEDATVTFKSANKQGGTITDCPVTKGQDVTIVMKDNRSLKSFNLTLKKWTTKAQTVTLHYSTDGGATYVTTSTTSSNFALAAEVPEGTNAIKFTFSSASNQVGIVSCELTFDIAQ